MAISPGTILGSYEIVAPVAQRFSAAKRASAALKARLYVTVTFTLMLPDFSPSVADSSST
jgi:hypothetical protein